MQKRSKTKVISILTVLAMLISLCFVFASCNSGGEQTLKYNIDITGENGDPLCALTDVEFTGAGITVLDATQNACGIIEITLVLDSDGRFVEQIGELKNGIYGAAEAELDDEGEEISPAVAGDYYYWEVSVNGTVLETGPAEYEIADGDKITWKWVVYDENAK